MAATGLSANEIGCAWISIMARLEHRLKLATLSARRKLVLSWAKHKQRIDLPCAKEKSAKSESWKCSNINTEWEENYGDDKTHRTQDGTHCPQDGT
jgi:hypothetical protein